MNYEMTNNLSKTREFIFKIENTVAEQNNLFKQTISERDEKVNELNELNTKFNENEVSIEKKRKLGTKHIGYISYSLVALFGLYTFQNLNNFSFTNSLYFIIVLVILHFIGKQSVNDANELANTNTKLSKDIRNIERNISNLDSKIISLTNDKDRNELLLLSTKNAIDFQSSYEIYKIKSDIDNVINENQQKIDNQYLINIVKLRTYIDRRQEIYLTSISNFGNLIGNAEKSDDVDSLINYVKENESKLKKCYDLTIKMVLYYSVNNMVDFFKIYNGFEEMGLFSSAAEKQLITSISQLNQNIGKGFNSLINKISELENSLSYSLSSIESSLDSIERDTSDIKFKLD
jgi:hypothetical protein